MQATYLLPGSISIDGGANRIVLTPPRGWDLRRANRQSSVVASALISGDQNHYAILGVSVSRRPIFFSPSSTILMSAKIQGPMTILRASVLRMMFYLMKHQEIGMIGT